MHVIIDDEAMLRVNRTYHCSKAFPNSKINPIITEVGRSKLVEKAKDVGISVGDPSPPKVKAVFTMPLVPERSFVDGIRTTRTIVTVV